MAIVELASNYKTGLGWKPYYHKSFSLGSVEGASEVIGEDGNQYVTRVDDPLISGTMPNVHAVQESDINCGYLYVLEFTSSSVAGGLTDSFIIEKWSLSNNRRPLRIIDVIIGSDLINQYKWRCTDGNPFYIDIGVKVYFGSDNTFATGMQCQIFTTTKEEMDKKKVWHGGYATWLRLPQNEGVIHRTPMIPTTLKNRAFTCIINAYGTNDFIANNSIKAPAIACLSEEDISTNARLAAGLEWNVNVDGHSDSSATMSTDYTFGETDVGDANTWQAGSEFIDDNDMLTATTFPSISHYPAETPVVDKATGTNQLLNVEAAGKAGFARVAFQHKHDAIQHNDVELARNQFWSIVVLIK